VGVPPTRGERRCRGGAGLHRDEQRAPELPLAAGTAACSGRAKPPADTYRRTLTLLGRCARLRPLAAGRSFPVSTNTPFSTCLFPTPCRPAVGAPGDDPSADSPRSAGTRGGGCGFARERARTSIVTRHVLLHHRREQAGRRPRGSVSARALQPTARPREPAAPCGASHTHLRRPRAWYPPPSYRPVQTKRNRQLIRVGPRRPSVVGVIARLNAAFSGARPK